MKFTGREDEFVKITKNNTIMEMHQDAEVDWATINSGVKPRALVIARSPILKQIPPTTADV